MGKRARLIIPFGKLHCRQIIAQRIHKCNKCGKIINVGDTCLFRKGLLPSRQHTCIGCGARLTISNPPIHTKEQYE